MIGPSPDAPAPVLRSPVSPRGHRWPACLLAMGAVLMAASGCATRHVIRNAEPVATGDGYQAQYRSPPPPAVPQKHSGITADRMPPQGPVAQPVTPATPRRTSVQMNAERCTSPAGAVSPTLPVRSVPGDVETLSVGDVLDVSVPDDTTFTGKYRVSQDGTVRMVFLPPVRAQGRSVAAVESAIAELLVEKGHYPAPPLVSVRVMDYASARVFVGGAVFLPGAYSVGGTPAADADPQAAVALGAASEGRRLSRALSSAGGVRPDADLSRVTVTRNGRPMVLDLRGAVQGRAFPDMLLLAGDQIEVASRGCFQEALMMPSPISPPGVKVFLSNLTVPASSNAQSVNGKETREMRWGTRLMQAAVGMNCVGGAVATNADRTIVLLTRNPMSGTSAVIERRLEDMLARADRDEFDPYLLPEDALACYDSNQTNLFDVTRNVGISVGTATGL